MLINLLELNHSLTEKKNEVGVQYDGLKYLGFVKHVKYAEVPAYSKHGLKVNMNLFILVNLLSYGINLKNIEKF